MTAAWLRGMVGSLMVLIGWTGAAGAAELTLVCGRAGTEFALCRDAAGQWADATGHAVRVLASPDLGDTRLALLKDLLEVQAPELDVMEIEVTWSGPLAEHLLDLGPWLAGARADFIDAALRNATVEGRLVALPWALDLGVLYYRKDLLERYGVAVPSTWTELDDAAQRLQEAERLLGNSGFWGYMWQGRGVDELTGNALEWIASQGGALVAPDGQVGVDQPTAQFALARAADWIGDISPERVLDDGEAESLELFAGSGAAFLRHWSVSWSRLMGVEKQPLVRFGMAPLPRGDGAGRSASSFRGWQLAVSRHSRHPDLAKDLVLYLTGAEVQRRRVMELEPGIALAPTRVALYTQTPVLQAQPWLADLVPVLPGLVPGPSAPTRGQYPVVNQAFYRVVRDILSGVTDPQTALVGLQRRLDRMSAGGADW